MRMDKRDAESGDDGGMLLFGNCLEVARSQQAVDVDFCSTEQQASYSDRGMSQLMGPAGASGVRTFGPCTFFDLSELFPRKAINSFQVHFYLQTVVRS